MPKYLQRLLRRPWARAFAILGTYLLTLQSARLPLITMAAPAACCCAQKDAHCQCQVCTHARAFESGVPFLGTCGQTSDGAVIVVTSDPVFPVDAPAPRPVAGAALAETPLQRPKPDPGREVATPPPLARS